MGDVWVDDWVDDQVDRFEYEWVGGQIELNMNRWGNEQVGGQMNGCGMCIGECLGVQGVYVWVMGEWVGVWVCE